VFVNELYLCGWSVKAIGGCVVTCEEMSKDHGVTTGYCTINHLLILKRHDFKDHSGGCFLHLWTGDVTSDKTEIAHIMTCVFFTCKRSKYQKIIELISSILYLKKKKFKTNCFKHILCLL
jgi:hypothetical protein